MSNSNFLFSIPQKNHFQMQEYHFPKVMDILNRQQKFNVDMTHREEVLTRIAKAIEDRCKRQKPTVHEYKKYESSKTEITENMKNMKHFDESDFPDCEKLVPENTKTTELDDVSSSDSEFTDFNESAKNVASQKKVNPNRFESIRVDRTRVEKNKDHR